jgi:hypothetical protein
MSTYTMAGPGRAVRQAVLVMATMMALLALAAAPAAAQADLPPWAGPPEVETVPVVDSDPPMFVCDGRILEFSAGDVTFRFKELPGGREVGVITLQDAEATDDDGTIYQVHGGAFFQGTEEEGLFGINLVFVGEQGDVERVNSLVMFRAGDFTLREHGSCTVFFEGDE